MERQDNIDENQQKQQIEKQTYKSSKYYGYQAQL